MDSIIDYALLNINEVYFSDAKVTLNAKKFFPKVFIQIICFTELFNPKNYHFYNNRNQEISNVTKIIIIVNSVFPPDSQGNIKGVKLRTTIKQLICLERVQNLAV